MLAPFMSEEEFKRNALIWLFFTTEFIDKADSELLKLVIQHCYRITFFNFPFIFDGCVLRTFSEGRREMFWKLI